MKKIIFKKYKNWSWIRNLVQFLINNDLFTHKGKFKVGDAVRYNWKAKVSILSAIQSNVNKTFIVREVRDTTDTSRITFSNGSYEGDGCDAFWLRKAYWWEI